MSEVLTQRVSVGSCTRLAERGLQLRSLFVLGRMLCSAALSSGENDLIKLQHLSKPSVLLGMCQMYLRFVLSNVFASTLILTELNNV